MADDKDKRNEDPTIRGEFATRAAGDSAEVTTGINISGEAASLLRQAAIGPTEVALQRSAAQPTEDQPLWVAIRNRARAISFESYDAFIQRVLCRDDDPDSLQREFASPSLSSRLQTLAGARRPTIQGLDAYKLLKLATEAFLVFECGLLTDDEELVGDEAVNLLEEERRLGFSTTVGQIESALAGYLPDTAANQNVLPYLNRIVRQIVGNDPDRQAERLPYCEAILRSRLTCPSFIELIWSYWEEEAGLVQTINAIALRFQNKQRGARDPLANLELDPLRPLNNLLWGFIQDESDRLSVQRRSYEYDHHYGISLVGKAVGNLNPADSRKKFIEAFHNLLYRAIMFYREDDDTTVVADAFALLNALREVHIVLAEGAHNQFGDLPWTARKEMLIMQWLLARPEIREFIRGRHMVPYQEPWMGAVDDMRRLQSWGDTTVTHFHELAEYGEQILLSVRYGDWIDINDQELARNWARYWRPEIQRYIHAYNAVTGVDLSLEMTDTSSMARRYAEPAALIAGRHDKALPPRKASGSQGRLRPPVDKEFDIHDVTAFGLRRLPRK